MKPVLLFAALAGLAALFFVLRGPTAPAVSAPLVDAGDPAEQAFLRELPSELQALRAELQAVRDEQSALALRVEELGSRPVAAAREPVGGPSSEEVAQAMEMVAAIQDPDRASAPELETFVLDVLGEKEERERAQREYLRQTAINDALNERVAELGKELGLSSYQEQQLFGVLSTEAAQRDAFFESLRETGTWDRRTMRDTMGKLRDDTLAQLQTVLTPEQLERYRELDDRRSFFGFGGGRGGPGGPGEGAERGDGGR